MSTRPPLEPTFEDVMAVTRVMADFPAPWWVAGGWAIDLFLGTVTRPHEDLEIGVARADQALLHRHLRGRELLKVVPRPETADLVPWSPDEWLALPIHQIVVRQPPGRPAEFQVFLNEIWSGEWRFRADETIRRPVEDSCVVSDSGVPVLAPDLQLLYKCRHHRPKDEHDFRVVLPRLDAARRSWLRDTLRCFRPADPWLAQFEPGL